MTTTKSTLRDQLQPLAADLEKAREVIGKVGEIIHRHTKCDDMSFDAGVMYWKYGMTGNPEFWLKLRNETAAHHETFESVIATVESYKPQDPEAEKQAKIAKLEAELAALKSS